MNKQSTKLIIVSGRSGSGKSTALHVLEDMGYYCVDNLPVGLIPTLVQQVTQANAVSSVAIGVDARNLPTQLAQFPTVLTAIRKLRIPFEIIYLDANDKTLLSRFSETRRKHPLSTEKISLAEALAKEKNILDPIAMAAHLTLDTSNLSLHQLRDLIRKRVNSGKSPGMSLMFYSFGFKHGIPLDADLVFDVRCLPNPHWIQTLRQLTGLEKPVIDYLEEQSSVKAMLEDIQSFLDKWLPKFEINNRSYMTIAIGCTGGQHRSVYFAEKLCDHYQGRFRNLQVRHRELDNIRSTLNQNATL